eukprot:TRINITY_DN71755_c1_g1_i1.p3 TRINITY_DN71755_c1_g1~~TRINITY_DN71755_c1_g1_i1.p3  ORF type:complete len:199 (-),score=43.39 TRINITY_DN71755_c1_g1_i1:173-733(-)
MIQSNLQAVTKLVEMVLKREELKKELLGVEVEQLVLQINRYHGGQLQTFENDQQIDNKRIIKDRLDAVSELGEEPIFNIPVPWELTLDLKEHDMPETIREEIKRKLGTCEGLVIQFGRSSCPYIRLKDRYLVTEEAEEEDVRKTEAEYWLPIYGEKLRRMELLTNENVVPMEIKQEQESSKVMGFP